MLFYCVMCHGLKEDVGAVAEGRIACKGCTTRMAAEFRPMAARVLSHPAYPFYRQTVMALMCNRTDNRSNAEIVEFTIALLDEAVMNGRF